MKDILTKDDLILLNDIWSWYGSNQNMRKSLNIENIIVKFVYQNKKDNRKKRLEWETPWYQTLRLIT